MAISFCRTMLPHRRTGRSPLLYWTRTTRWTLFAALDGNHVQLHLAWPYVPSFFPFQRSSHPFQVSGEQAQQDEQRGNQDVEFLQQLSGPAKGTKGAGGIGLNAVLLPTHRLCLLAGCRKNETSSRPSSRRFLVLSCSHPSYHQLLLDVATCTRPGNGITCH